MKAVLLALVMALSVTVHAKEEKPCPFKNNKSLFSNTVPKTVYSSLEKGRKKLGVE